MTANSDRRVRVELIDFARGVAVVLMVLVHTHDVYGHEATLFPWGAFVLAGMSYGALLEERGRVVQSTLPTALWTSVGLSLAGGFLCLRSPEDHVRDFFHMGPGLALALLGMSGLAFVAFQWVLPLVPGGLLDFLLFCGRHVTGLYIVHIAVLVWGTSLVGFHQLGRAGVCLAFFLVLLVSLASYQAWRRLPQLLSRLLSSTRSRRARKLATLK